MTSDATSLSISALPGGLIDRDPLRPILVKRRRLLVTPEIAEIFDGKKNVGGFPINGDLVVHDFIAGWAVNVSQVRAKRKPSSPPVHIEKIIGCDEVWALCVRKPPPGWRFFGRFLARNVLVLVSAYDKADRGEQYQDECAKVKQMWEEIFPSNPPHSGDTLDDYLSRPYYDVDEASRYT